MTKKQERIPGMRDTSPNREQRRNPTRDEDEPIARDVESGAEQDVEDVRTSSGGHKKKTADKWNQ